MNSFKMQLRSFILLAIILESVYADSNVDTGCTLQITDKEPEAICGSDLQIYYRRVDFKLAKCLDKIGLYELPFYMCTSAQKTMGEENEVEDIGMRFLDLPTVTPQNKFNPNTNKRTLIYPGLDEQKYGDRFHRQRSIHQERQPIRNRYYGRTLKQITHPMRYSDHNRNYRYPFSGQYRQNVDRSKYYSKPRPLLNLLNAYNQSPYSIHESPLSPMQHSSVPSANPFDTRNDFQQITHRHLLNLPIFYSNDPRNDLQLIIPASFFSPPIFHRIITPRTVDGFLGKLSPDETKNSTCNEDSTSKDVHENEKKAKSGGRSADENSKEITKPKHVKPKQKSKPQKPLKKPGKLNKATNDNEEEFRSLNLDSENQNEIDDVENPQQVIAERSNLKVPQNGKTSSEQKSKKVEQKTDNFEADKTEGDTINEKIIPKLGNEDELNINNVEKIQNLDDEATDEKSENPDKTVEQTPEKEDGATTVKS